MELKEIHIFSYLIYLSLGNLSLFFFCLYSISSLSTMIKLLCPQDTLQSCHRLCSWLPWSSVEYHKENEAIM